MRNELSNPEQINARPELEKDAPSVATPKKEFIEPKLSVPVDVLEATTFFQATDTGVTN